MTKVRIYGKELRRWTTTNENGREILVQVELSYKEYDEEGNLVGTGSEDFSKERWSSEIKRDWVWTWNGVQLNRGGHRQFTCWGLTTYRKTDKKAVKALMAKRYNAVTVELR